MTSMRRARRLLLIPFSFFYDLSLTSGVHADSYSFQLIFLDSARYVLAMAYCLVLWGTFKKVKICFLPVGHTHDDCDQCFSCLNRKFKELDLLTLKDLIEACKAAYPGDPSMVHLDTMGNWTSLFEPMLKKATGISKPRVFVVRRDDKGVVRHHYRQQMQTSKKDDEDCWYPVNSVGHQLIEGAPDVDKLVSVPFKPVDGQELRDVAKMGKPYMDDEQAAWWDKTIDDFLSEDENQCPECTSQRTAMQDNARSKNDSKEDATRKGGAQHKIRKAMLDHLDAPSVHHAPFMGYKKTPCYYHWISEPDAPGGGHYEDEVEVVDDDEDESDRALLRQAADLQRENLSNHFVGGVLSRDRSRPATVEPGTLLVILFFVSINVWRARHSLILLFYIITFGVHAAPYYFIFIY
jgi:hypothetical protein